jgi:hypothetical protein
LNQKWYIAKNKRLRVDVYRAEDGGLKTKFMDETGNQTYYYTQKVEKSLDHTQTVGKQGLLPL